MSEPHGQTGHGGHGDVPPVSRGIVPSIWLLVAISIVVVVIQGAFVVMSSGMGHVWPATDSLKVPLPPPQ